MFITLEGPEGAGKSTLLRALSARFEELGRTVVQTREPGSGAVGTAIRQILLDGEELIPIAETFLFLADRAHHVGSVIRPSLVKGDVVLCDRHADSTVVYQGYARGGDIEQLRKLNAIATDGLGPDLTILLDIDPTIGLARQQRSDRLGGLPLDFHQRVREGFLSEARLDVDRWIVLDAGLPPQDVAEQAWACILKRLD